MIPDESYHQPYHRDRPDRILRLATRAWRALGAFIAGVALFGFYRLNVPPGRSIPSLQVDPSPEQLARGERLAYLCVGCHSSSGKLPLDGGTENFAEALMPPVA